VKHDCVYDLTEVLLASTGKLRYYGIVRVVAEIGAALRKIDPHTRFCIYSPGHDCFYEIFPTVGADGVVELNVPEGVRQLRVRRLHYTKNKLRDALVKPVRALANYLNRRAWRKAGIDLPELDLAGKVFVSCARPKLIVDATETLRRQGKTCQIVPMLHDMIPLHDHFSHRQSSFPTNFVGDNQTIVARASLILANSEFTRDEVLSFSGQGQLPPVSRVVAVPLVHECPEGTEPADLTMPQEPYLLAIGAATGRKNLEVVFDAMLVLHAAGKPVPQLVLAGALRKRTAAYLEAERFAPIRDRVIIRVNPNQTDLVALYRNAEALVIASRMEGWGLPAGEALWLGTPAICSTAPVLREVCGDLGLYFDPDSPEELAQIIDRLLSDQQFAIDLRARIEAAKPSMRTWKTVAAEIQEELEKL
jgi:glycosyltransferase involved in cell wall biosynthesis